MLILVAEKVLFISSDDHYVPHALLLLVEFRYAKEVSHQFEIRFLNLRLSLEGSRKSFFVNKINLIMYRTVINRFRKSPC